MSTCCGPSKQQPPSYFNLYFTFIPFRTLHTAQILHPRLPLNPLISASTALLFLHFSAFCAQTICYFLYFLRIAHSLQKNRGEGVANWYDRYDQSSSATNRSIPERSSHLSFNRVPGVATGTRALSFAVDCWLSTIGCWLLPSRATGHGARSTEHVPTSTGPWPLLTGKVGRPFPVNKWEKQ